MTIQCVICTNTVHPSVGRKSWLGAVSVCLWGGEGWEGVGSKISGVNELLGACAVACSCITKPPVNFTHWRRGSEKSGLYNNITEEESPIWSVVLLYFCISRMNICWVSYASFQQLFMQDRSELQFQISSFLSSSKIWGKVPPIFFLHNQFKKGVLFMFGFI